jgi:hypothetical protein
MRKRAKARYSCTIKQKQRNGIRSCICTSGVTNSNSSDEGTELHSRTPWRLRCKGTESSNRRGIDGINKEDLTKALPKIKNGKFVWPRHKLTKKQAQIIMDMNENYTNTEIAKLLLDNTSMIIGGQIINAATRVLFGQKKFRTSSST